MDRKLGEIIANLLLLQNILVLTLKCIQKVLYFNFKEH